MKATTFGRNSKAAASKAASSFTPHSLLELLLRLVTLVTRLLGVEAITNELRPMNSNRIVELGEHSPPVREEHKGAVTVWKFPYHFSQSKLGGRDHTSNACTIIAIKIAEWIVKGNVLNVNMLENASSLENPQKFILAIANGILDGNEVHGRECITQNLRPGNQNFTIPAAIRACNDEFAEMDFCVQKGEMYPALYKHVLKAVAFWQKLPHRMSGGSSSMDANGENNHAPNTEKGMHRNQLFLLVVANERTILIVYFPGPADKFVVVDSHTHGPHGVVVAMTDAANLSSLCRWVPNCLFPDHCVVDTGFEISLVVHKTHSNYSQAYERQKKANAKHVCL